MTQLTGNHSV